jgi:hypothetical protein
VGQERIKNKKNTKNKKEEEEERRGKERKEDEPNWMVIGRRCGPRKKK